MGRLSLKFVVSGFALGVTATLVLQIVGWQLTREYLAVAAEHEPLGNYEITITDDSELLIVKGAIASGISADVQAILEQDSEIRGVVLSSVGGLVAEGHQLASLIIEYRLDTFAHENCYSACMIAFAAGAERFLVSGTTLGFHQYSDGIAEQDTGMGRADIEEAERFYFLSRGISEQFLARIFRAHHEDMWHPTVDELLQAGVIHDIRLPSSLDLNWDGTPAKFLGVDITEIILDQFSAFNVLKAYDIEMYERIKHDIASEMERGRSPAEMQRIGMVHNSRLVTSAMPNTANATAVNYFAEMIAVMRELNEHEPFYCVVYALPDLYSTAFNPGLISLGRQNKLSDALAAVIEDSYTIRAPAIDQRRAEQVIVEISDRMASRLDVIDPAKMSTEEDYRKACEALIALNEAVFNYSTDDAGNTIRSLLSQK